MSLANPRWGAPRIQWGIDETRYFDLANNRRQVHDPVSEATITTSQRFSASLDSAHWSSGYRMRIELQVGHTWVVFLQAGSSKAPRISWPAMASFMLKFWNEIRSQLRL